MARRKVILVLPHLNDYGGDMSKNWYVEYAFRIPGDNKLKRERKYFGMIPDRTKRTKAINIYIKEKTTYLRSGKHLQENNQTVIYEDMLQFDNVAKLYGRQKESVVNIRIYLNEYLAIKKTAVNKSSLQTHIAKLRAFCAFMEHKNYIELDVSNITNEIIIEFLQGIAENLARVSVKKYTQILHDFFRFLQKVKKVITVNPVTDIPILGRIVDCSPIPFHLEDRQKLKELISKENPQLWLACEIQFYCAIRPGTEIRLMKIRMIDFARGCFIVPSETAKNNQTEIVSIPKQLLTTMKDIYKLDTYNSDLYIFGRHGYPACEPYGKNTLRNRFNYYRDALGLNKGYKFYSWKHTGAIAASENGMTIYDLQHHLRHKSIETTEQYIRKRTNRTSHFVRDKFPEI